MRCFYNIYRKYLLRNQHEKPCSHFFSPHSCSALLPCTITMPSKGAVSFIATRSLTTSNVFALTSRRAYSHFPPTRRRCPLQQSRTNCLLIGRRTFSTTPWRGLADVDESFDPREQDRESDEVDVCIVGGGMSSGTPTVKHANVLQDPPASPQPFVSNKSLMKLEMKTSESFFWRRQARWAPISSPAMSLNRPPSTNCSQTGIIQIIRYDSKMLPRLLMTRCAFSPETALYQFLRLHK